MSILLVDGLGVCLAVWVEKFLAAFLPHTFHLRRRMSQSDLHFLVTARKS